MDGLYTLAIAAGATYRQVRFAARAELQCLEAEYKRWYRFFDTHASETVIPRLMSDVESDDIRRRAGAICLVHWIYDLRVDGIDVMLPHVIDAMSDECDVLRRGAALSGVDLVYWDNSNYQREYDTTPLEFVAPLVKALDDPDPAIRGHAAGILGQHIGTGDKSDIEKRETFCTAADHLIDLLHDDSSAVRGAVLSWLQSSLFSYVVSGGLEALQTDYPASVPENVSERLVIGLIQCLEDEAPIVRARVAEIIRSQATKSPGEQPALYDISPDADLPVDGLWHGLTDPTKEHRIQVARFIAELTTTSPASLGKLESTGRILATEWLPAVASDSGAILSSSQDPLVAIAEHGPDDAADLGREYYRRTPDARQSTAIDTLEAMETVAPAAIGPVLAAAKTEDKS